MCLHKYLLSSTSGEFTDLRWGHLSGRICARVQSELEWAGSKSALLKSSEQVGSQSGCRAWWCVSLVRELPSTIMTNIPHTGGTRSFVDTERSSRQLIIFELRSNHPTRVIVEVENTLSRGLEHVRVIVCCLHVKKIPMCKQQLWVNWGAEILIIWCPIWVSDCIIYIQHNTVWLE